MKDKIKSFFSAVAGFFTRLKKKLTKKRGEPAEERRKPRFRPLRNFWILLALIISALIFTQALISSVSTVIFIFLLLLPLVSLLHIVIAFPAIKIYLDSDATEAEKMTELSFSLAISNESPIPFPFVEAEISIPSDKGIRSESSLTMLSLIPFGSYVIDNKAVFRYRGQYDIGVSDVYVYDFFRFFCVRIELNMFRQIFVMPRRLIKPGSNGSETTIENTDTVIRRYGSDNTETSDIRTYIQGDSMRSIHWKLSGKTEDLMVRQYSQNSEQQTFIFCDTAMRYAPDDGRFEDDVNEYTVDGVVEAAIATVTEGLKKANASVSLIWFDDRGIDDVCCVKLTSLHDFDETYRLFATAPITKTDRSLAGLTAMVLPGDASNISLVYITGCADKTFASSMTGIATAGAAGTEVYVFSPAEKVKEEHRQAFFDEAEFAVNELGKNGVIVRSAHFDAPDRAAKTEKEVKA